MKRTVSTLLVGLAIVAAAGVMTQVRQHVDVERLKAGRQSVSSLASQARQRRVGDRERKTVRPADQPSVIDNDEGVRKDLLPD
jgi:hypothetical protein